mgnify:CR=1 FL=1
MSDVAVLALTGMPIQNAQYSTSDPSALSLTTFNLTGGQTTNAMGGFFGPQADETGGVVSLDDTNTGTIKLIANFAAD